MDVIVKIVIYSKTKSLNVFINVILSKLFANKRALCAGFAFAKRELGEVRAC
jgi:hypothetical protein